MTTPKPYARSYARRSSSPRASRSESGLHSDLEDIVEHLAKTRNAYARGESERVFRHAWHVAKNVRRALVPFGPVEPARRGGETEERALATMPRAFRDDLALVAGETSWARDPRAVVVASARVARDVVTKLETLSDPPLHEPLRADLTSGRVRALVDRMKL
jgi:plasmid stabilization system protein ParE